MSLKTPVVASAVGEIPKVLGDGEGGELLSDVEPATITEAIEKIVNDEDLSSRKTDWGYEVVRKHYSSEAMAEQYLEFYNEVLAKP